MQRFRELEKKEPTTWIKVIVDILENNELAWDLVIGQVKNKQG